MIQLTCRSFAATAAGLAFMALSAVPAQAQFQPRSIPSPTTGETYRVEGGVSWWNPGASMQITSGGSGALSGIPGTSIDAKTDLGFVDKRMPQFQAFFRAGEGHKFRFQYIPINYSASTTLTRSVDFNGQRYTAGLPVTSTMDWKAFRFGYEYDFIRKDTGFVGFITELKYTDVNVNLNSQLTNESFQKKAPIPALGGIARVYVVPAVAITGELTLFKMPTVEDRYSGHYTDLDIYGTVNLSNNIGFQGGYRSLSLGYLIKEDTGLFVLKGIYYGVVARF